VGVGPTPAKACPSISGGLSLRKRGLVPVKACPRESEDGEGRSLSCDNRGGYLKQRVLTLGVLVYQYGFFSLGRPGEEVKIIL